MQYHQEKFELQLSWVLVRSTCNYAASELGYAGLAAAAEQGSAHKHEDGGPDEDDEGITLEA